MIRKKGFKKVSALFLVLVMVFSAMSTVLAEDEDFAKYKPLLKVEAGDIPVLQAGEKVSVPIMIFNDSRYRARYTTMEVNPQNSEEILKVNNIVDIYNVPDIQGGERLKMYINLDVLPKAKSGYYKLKLDFKYQSPYGVAFEGTQLINIQIVNPKDGETTTPTILPELAATNATLSKAIFNYENDNRATLSVMVKNTGKVDAKNISVNLGGLSSEGISLDNDFEAKVINNLAVGASAKINFKVFVATGLQTGNVPLMAKMTYNINNNEKKEIESPIFVYLKKLIKPAEKPSPTPTTKPDAKLGVPRLILDKYDLDVEQIKAGEPFTFTFDITNTSSATVVNNIKMVISSADGIFIALDGSNSFFVKSLGKGESVKNSITLISKNDAETKSYPISIKLDYEDSKTEAHSSEEMVTLPVVQPQRPEIGEITTMVESAAMGMPFGVNFQYLNKGKSILYNTSISVEGDFKLQEGDFYIGNLAASANDFFDGMIVSETSGELSGEIVVKYEDVNGKAQELRKSFTTFVPETMPVVDPTVDPMPEPELTPNFFVQYMWWIIGGGAGIIAIILVIVFVKIAKRKKRLREEAEYDDE